MDDILHFSDGLNTDVTKLDQPKTSWRDMQNGVLLSENGNIFRPSNERGTIEKIAGFPSGFKIIGGYNLNTDYICVLVDPVNGYSQVGVIDNTYTYTRKVPTDTDANSELGFVIEHQVDCEAKKLFSGERVLYFTDNFNPFGFVNIDNPPVTGDIKDNVRLIQNQSTTKIDLIEIIENIVGGIRPGVYQFATVYKDSSFNRSTISLISNPIPMVDEVRAVGRDRYDGAYPTDTTINKNIKIQISNIDTSFPYLEIIAIYYEGITNTFKAVTLPIINITSDTINFIYTGLETTTGEITLNELVALPISYDRAKCVAQKDDMLIFSNLSDKSSRFDDVLQKIANRITINYQIKEVQYLESGLGSLIFDLMQPAYVDENDSPGFTKVILEFNDNVSSVSGTTLTNFELDIDGDNVSDYNPTSAVVLGNKITLTFATPPAPFVPLPTIAPFPSLKITGITNATESQSYSDVGFIPLGYKDLSDGGIITTNGFTDYKNEALTFYNKSYLRNEVYSLGLFVTFKDGTTSYSYHIPGNNKTASSNAIPNTPGNYSGETSGQLGTYISTLTYPRFQNYPGNLTGDDTSVGAVNRNIRHHKMPSLTQEPHFRYDAANNVSYIRILGIVPDLTAAKSLFTPELLAEIQSIGFCRQRRNAPQNRSILAQGIANRMQSSYNDYQYNGGAPVLDSLIWRKTPFFDNTTVTIDNISPDGSGGSATYNSPSTSNQDLAFFSPDILFNRLSEGDVSGAILKEELVLDGVVDEDTKVFRASENTANKLGPFPGFIITVTLRRFYLAFLLGNYYKENTITLNQSIPITEAKIISTNTTQGVASLPKPIDNNTSLKFLYVHLQSNYNNVDSPQNSNINIRLAMNTGVGPLGNSTTTNYDSLYTSSGINPNISTRLLNLSLNNPQQYGSINNNEYIPIANYIIDYNNNAQIPNDYGTVFGGDIFISKFAIANSDIHFYKARLYQSVNPGSGNYTNDNAISHLGNPDFKGMDLRALNYFFVESIINTNYRHQYHNYQNNTDGPKYYPKDSFNDVISQDMRNGESDSYNTQYSFENNIKPLFNKSSSLITVGKYETRNIYSLRSQQDDLVDNYRIFPTNNYHDLPKHTGEIWDTFVLQNTFYMHTPKCLWRGYVNELSQQANSLGEVITGTGGVFSIPSREVLTKEGGYGGSISQWAGTRTPTGYIFPDALQGKMFLLSSGQLTDISMSGMSMYFDSNLGIDLTENYTDNPANPNSAGIIATYDSSLKRYIMIKRGTSKDFTLSYSLLSNKWISFHSYSPNAIIPIDNKIFGFDNSKPTVQMHQHNVGLHGVYYNNPPEPFSMDIVLNYPPIISKTQDNIAINTTSYNNTNVNRLDTFKLIRCTNDFQDSDNINLVCGDQFDDGSNIKKVQNQFQLAIPRNSLGDPNYPDRMRGEYLLTHLEYPNTDNFKLIVNSITLAERRSFR